MWADWLHHPCCLGGPQCFGAGDKIRGGPVWGYIITAVSGVTNTSKRWENQDRAHMWAVWLHHPNCLSGPQCFAAGHKIRMGPTCGRIGYITPAASGVPNAPKLRTKSEMGQHVGGFSTSSLLSRGSPALQSGGQNQNRAHMWADWLHHPCCLGVPKCFGAGEKIRMGPTCGSGYITFAVSGVPNAPKRST